MTRPFTIRWRFALLMLVVTLELVPFSGLATPVAVHAQDVTADPRAVSPVAGDLRTGFQFVPEKSEQREPVPGIVVYEADFVRDQTPKNFADGPIEIKSLVAKTANSQQAAEQYTSSRQALTTASPAWTESKVAKLGDEATGLTMQGQSSDGQAAVAHLFLFRRGGMVVGITVAGLTKPTKMAEAEAIAAVVLRKLDPTVKAQAGASQARQLNTQRPPATTSGTASPASNSTSGGATATTNTASTTTASQRVRVAKTGGTGVRLRVEPSRTARVAAVLPDGTMLDIVGEDRQADGLTWRSVRAPGDGRGWVAADYVEAVAGTASTTQATTAASPPATTTSSNTTAAPAAQPSAATPPAASSAPSTTSTGDILKVDVNVKKAKVKTGDEQSVEVVVSKNGQPVSSAQVSVKTSPTGETPTVPATDASGKTTVTWKTTGSPGFIGVGVSAVGSDGSAGVGGASFEITGS